MHFELCYMNKKVFIIQVTWHCYHFTLSRSVWSKFKWKWINEEMEKYMQSQSYNSSTHVPLYSLVALLYLSLLHGRVHSGDHDLVILR